jgi:ubiquinone/menaquinone biosynthesis C-methylase UbiE
MLYGHWDVSSLSDSDRARDLEIIKRRYTQYAGSNRYDLWSLSNPGFRRLVYERDRSIMELLRNSIPPNGGSVVDLGSGSSRLAGIAHDAGIQCDWLGLDIDETAVAESSRTYPWARFVVASADRIPLPDASVDVMLASVLFSSLPSHDFERDVARDIGRVLRPGGWLIWFDLRIDNPSNPAVHGISRRRLEALFPGWEPEVESSTLLPPIARRLGRTTPFLYPMLVAVPLLRSHLIGRLHCPT